jgi:hypothetical protein
LGVYKLPETKLPSRDCNSLWPREAYKQRKHAAALQDRCCGLARLCICWTYAEVLIVERCQQIQSVMRKFAKLRCSGRVGASWLHSGPRTQGLQPSRLLLADHQHGNFTSSSCLAIGHAQQAIAVLLLLRCLLRCQLLLLRCLLRCQLLLQRSQLSWNVCHLCLKGC